MRTRLIAFAIGLLAFDLAAAAVTVTGAGHPGPDPLLAKWSEEFRKVDRETRLVYQIADAPAAASEFLQGQRDFLATDLPLNDRQAGGGVRHVPVAVSGVAVVYNVPGLKGPLKLSRRVLAALFAGEIATWDHPEIAALNPGLGLPKGLKVTVTFRLDDDGTTLLMRQFLGEISEFWKAREKQALGGYWVQGLGARSASALIGLIQQNPGAIGYLDVPSASLNTMAMASLENPSKRFVHPTFAALSGTVGLATQALASDLRVPLLNLPGKEAYPLTSLTFVVVRRNLADEKAKKLADFLKWSLGPGQDLVETMRFARLPPKLAERVGKGL